MSSRRECITSEKSDRYETTGSPNMVKGMCFEESSRQEAFCNIANQYKLQSHRSLQALKSEELERIPLFRAYRVEGKGRTKGLEYKFELAVSLQTAIFPFFLNITLAIGYTKPMAFQLGCCSGGL